MKIAYKDIIKEFEKVKGSSVEQDGLLIEYYFEDAIERVAKGHYYVLFKKVVPQCRESEEKSKAIHSSLVFQILLKKEITRRIKKVNKKVFVRSLIYYEIEDESDSWFAILLGREYD